MHSSGITLIEKTDLVCEGDGVLYGFLVWTDAQQEEITIYDGLDAGSGRKIINVGVDVYESFSINFIPGVHFETGLYVILTGNIKSASIMFNEARKIEAMLESASDEIIAAF